MMLAALFFSLEGKKPIDKATTDIFVMDDLLEKTSLFENARTVTEEKRSSSGAKKKKT